MKRAEENFLKTDILRLKDKLKEDADNERYAARMRMVAKTDDQNTGEISNITQFDDPEIIGDLPRINLRNGNFSLTTVDVLDQTTDEYESKLVYQNNRCTTDMENKLKRELDEEFGPDDNSMDEYVNDNERLYMMAMNDILESVKLDEILKPITKPSEVVTIPAINKIYKSQYLERMANDTVEVIQKEQQNVNLLNKIMDVFLNKDPSFLLADTLGLAEYDHKLDSDLDETSDINGNKVLQNEVITDNDPFFKVPPYGTNHKLDGIKQEEVDETRQLVQIALQRNEEFIRSLEQMRQGFLHADTYRKDVYGWCKEMYEEEVSSKK